MKDEPLKFSIAEKIYRHLLMAYPRRHRAEYGEDMAQLFRDQCRDAWKESRHWGLLKLWLRVLSDWVSTCILERLAALKERKTMTDKRANLFGFHATPASTFFKVFTLVFLLVFLASVAITFILPKSYASTARIVVQSDAPVASGPPSYDPYFIETTLQIIQSESVLKPVVEQLNLNNIWGRKYYNGQTLKTPQTLEILKQRLQLAPVRDTSVIAITVFSDDKNEAAQIANAVAGCYRDYRAGYRHQFTMATMEALQQQYDEQEKEILARQAQIDSLQKALEIPDKAEGLAGMLADTTDSVQKQEQQLSELRNMDSLQRREALPSVVPDPNLSTLLGKFQDAEQQYASLTNDYCLTNHVVTRVASLVGELNHQIDDQVAGVMAGLETRLDASKEAMQEIAAKVQRSKPTPETQVYWNQKQDLEQLVESHKALYAKIQEQKLDAQLPQPPLVQITDPAEPGVAPVKPNKPLNIILGAVGGLFSAFTAGAAFAFLSHLVGKNARKPIVAA